MDPTHAFLLVIGSVALATLIFLLALTSTVFADRFAAGFRLLCVVTGLFGLLGVIALTLRLPPSVGFYRHVIDDAANVGLLVVGGAVGAVLAAGLFAAGRWRSASVAATRSVVASPVLASGLGIFVALAFFGFEIGKGAHDAEMRQFFTSSGFPIAFMYVVMAAEILGALGLLVARTRAIAAGLLGLIMVGAMATHARNGDPFSDSLDAVRTLLLVASLLTLALLRRRSLQGARRRSKTG